MRDKIDEILLSVARGIIRLQPTPETLRGLIALFTMAAAMVIIGTGVLSFLMVLIQ